VGTAEYEAELILTDMEESEKEDSWVPTAITASYGRKNTIAPERRQRQ
jgi:hypothetical protein